MKVGFCHYHKYPLTLRQMRLHGCLRKNGEWCKRFIPNLDHPFWKDRLEKGKSKKYAHRLKKGTINDGKRPSKETKQT